jgi:regulator of PEP synthase PpsR (kinase-PPPase family)
MATKGPQKVFIVSDATGETAEKVVQAALLQFPASKVKIRYFLKIRHGDEIDRIMKIANDDRAFVAYTLVDTTLRQHILELAEQLEVDTHDLIGSLIVKLSQFLSVSPAMEAGLKAGLDADYFKRVEAVEFAVKHDDGQEPRHLAKADIVLVGLSRTSKTPLSTYLAQKGFKVANIPLVPEIPPPTELSLVDQQRVHALIIDLPTLVRIRRERLKHLGMPSESTYAMRDNVKKELQWCRTFYQSHPGWSVHDVTGKAVEETAAKIINLHDERFGAPQQDEH